MPTDSSQISKDLDGLRECWYSIAKLCEGINRYGSAKEDGFRDSLDAILSGIESFEKLLEEVHKSIVNSFPAYPQKIESRKNEILEKAALLKDRVGRDKKKVASFKEKDGEIIKDKLEKLREGYEDVERETSESCNKYFDRKKEYTIALEKIEREVGKRVEAMREAFLKKISEIVDGYDITFHGRIISTSELFDNVIEGRGGMNFEGIQVKALNRGGFFDVLTGTASKQESAKESVLKYEVQQITQNALPLKQKEVELKTKLDRMFNDLKGLEDDCKKAEEKRREVVETRDRLRMELKEVDAPEKLRNTYLKNFEEATPKVESFISLTKVIGESGSWPEVEKEVIKATIEAKEGELHPLKTKISEGDSKEELLEYKKKVEELKILIETLEKELERRIDEIED